MPAQLTRISQRPSVAATSWASAATEASEETSHLQAIALRPAFCTSATVSAPDAMSEMTAILLWCDDMGLPFLFGVRIVSVSSDELRHNGDTRRARAPSPGGRGR